MWVSARVWVCWPHRVGAWRKSQSWDTAWSPLGPCVHLADEELRLGEGQGRNMTPCPVLFPWWQTSQRLKNQSCVAGTTDPWPSLEIPLLVLLLTPGLTQCCSRRLFRSLFLNHLPSPWNVNTIEILYIVNVLWPFAGSWNIITSKTFFDTQEPVLFPLGSMSPPALGMHDLTSGVGLTIAGSQCPRWETGHQTAVLSHPPCSTYIKEILRAKNVQL